MPARRDKRLPAVIVNRMIRHYLDGATIRLVAERNHVSMNTAWRYLDASGIQMRPCGGNQLPELHEEDDRVTRCIELYNLGYSTVEIGRELGICHSTVRYRLLRAGVQLRTREESARLRWNRRPKARV